MHEGQVLLAKLRRPSDDAAARRQPPCRGADSEHGDQEAVAVVDCVAHLRTSQDLAVESVGACIL